VRYLATLIGSTDEATMRWFILRSRCCSIRPPSYCSWRQRTKA
jgi:hypothetical protein